MKRIIPMILACTMVLGTTAWAETEDAENETLTAAQADDGLFASTHEVTDSPDWLKELPSGRLTL
jgi:hypothetical protein